MKKICLIILSLLLFTTPAFALELGVFEINGFTQLRGLVEPPEHMTPTPTVRARIILLPSIKFGLNSVFINDANGNKVSEGSLSSASPPLSVYVRLFIVRSSPSDDEKYQILHEVNPDIPAPMLLRDLPNLPQPTGTPAIDSSNGALYQSNLRRWESSRFPYQELLRLHQFLPSMPRNIEIAIKQGGSIVGTYKSRDETRIVGGVVDVPLQNGLTVAQLRPLLRGELSAEATFSIDTTNFQSLSGQYQQTDLSNAVVDSVRKELSSASASSTGFLFWESTIKRISTSVNESISKTVNNRGASGVEIRNYDTSDQSKIALMESFLFPKMTKEVVIAQHKIAAEEAKKSGNTSLEKLHLRFIASITNGSDELGKGFDSFDALLSLADGDLLGFLSSGFSFKETSGSSNLTYRKIASRNISSEQFRKFSSQLFTTVEQYYGVSALPQAGFSF